MGAAACALLPPSNAASHGKRGCGWHLPRSAASHCIPAGGDQRGGCPPAVLGGKDAAPPCQGALPGLKRWLGEGFLPWCHLSLLLF